MPLHIRDNGSRGERESVGHRTLQLNHFYIKISSSVHVITFGVHSCLNLLRIHSKYIMLPMSFHHGVHKIFRVCSKSSRRICCLYKLTNSLAVDGIQWTALQINFNIIQASVTFSLLTVL